MRRVGETILATLAVFDWAALGCAFPVTGKVGILCAQKQQVSDPRAMIENAYEPLRKAEKQGPGTLCLESV
jgi:hypothetical protein